MLTNLTIDDIDRGFLVEQINEHLSQLIADIVDPNKEATKKRSVNIEIAFAPSKSRRDAQLTYKVTLKPSTHIERDSQTIYIGKAEDGTPIAKPYVIEQPMLNGVELLADDAETAPSGSNNGSN